MNTIARKPDDLMQYPRVTQYSLLNMGIISRMYDCLTQIMVRTELQS